jgi:pimeloyl-ACP methyl ester carboxylesterase
VPVLDLPQGPLAVRDSGGAHPGPTFVLVHGVLVDGRLWDPVVARLRGEHRLVALDLPLGAHRSPMRPGADLTPPGLARLVADALAALELRDVLLVGNDTGGAIAQLVAAHHPERLAGLALTNCDAYEHFPPPVLRPLVAAARAGLAGPVLRATRLRAVRAALWLLVARRRVPTLLADWTAPLQDPAIRRDAAAAIAGVDARHTLDAAARLRAGDLPVLLAWAMRDRLFPGRLARRLAADLPGARLVELPGDRTFVMLDQPDATAAALRSFAASLRAPVGRRLDTSALG